MAGRRHRRPSSPEIEKWELDLIAQAARTVDPSEQKEFMGEIARKLLILKRRSRAQVQHWPAYVKQFLKNKASNWGRDWRKREKKRALLDPLVDYRSDEILPSEIARVATNEDIDSKIAFAQFWEELDPELQRFWLVLERKGGNQAAAAKSLRVHRNTVRLWIQEIRRLLKIYGLGGD